ASAAATSSSASLRLLTKPPKPLLSKPHLLTLCAPVSFQRLVARSSASPTPSPSAAAAAAAASGSGVDPAQLPPALRDIVALFQSVPDPRTRYKQLLAYAARLPPMDPALKTDANRVRGCVSQVWVHAAPEEGGAPGRVSFQADSDAQLTKGLAALLVLGLSGAPARDVAMVPVEFIELLGIRQSLSPSRNSGLLNMLSLMKRKALEVATGEVTTEEIGSQEVVQEVAERPAAKEKEPEFAAFGAREEEGSEVHSPQEEQLEEMPADVMEGNGGLGGGRQERIKESLERGLSPVQLQIEDISHLHKGHAGVSGSNGETHFNVRVVSEAFQGKSLLKRHRAVYDLLQDELKNGLHALSIDAKTPSEV
ncbi:Os09g0270900, partial [Oryza sativa Japonica Group]